ncbi:MAG: chemotaxis response regulator protein-glutamate methylesterase [Leptospiraceae bacterium]|nr:chemotaxis response regulator protein-glutamate methylesterase [Leptospiraceae bacterium]MCP5498433.1 chemotaxis response regulator protein-glutamate methylesterase [Leptospiraceae bacterium]
MHKKIRVLVIDDSPLVRNIITDLLEAEEDIEVIATGKTGLDCIELSQKLKPDIITLDVEMPVMDGLTALKELYEKNMKIGVLMLSAVTRQGAKATFKALELGAYDFIPKPSSALKMELQELGNILRTKIRGYFEHKYKPRKRIRIKVGNFPDVKKFPIQAIGIGTSTGGPNALQKIFSSFPEDFRYPVFVVQHMPAGFTKAFAERLDDTSNLTVKEAEHGELVRSGVAYVAPGNYHMRLKKKDDNISIELDQGNLVNGHRPSIDVTLDSLCNCYGSSLVGVIMTGMGKDGALSMKKVKELGGATISQDEKTSVIFGMNKQAIEMGAIDHIVPLEDIVSNILRIIKERGK